MNFLSASLKKTSKFELSGALTILNFFLPEFSNGKPLKYLLHLLLLSGNLFLDNIHSGAQILGHLKP
jgi:hypothetical protein